MRRIILSFIFFLFTSLLIAGELPEYPCYQLIEEPVLDGKIEESIWSNIPSATGFYILGGNYAVFKQTYFKAGWTKEAIYIAVKSIEPEPEKMKAELKDGHPLWSEDSIEIFFFPKDVGNYFQFVVNSIGSRWNGIGSGESKPVWNWEAKTYIGKDFWSLEVKIPFSILERVPTKEEKWLTNIARNTLTGPASERYTCWPPLKSSFHDIANFGSFIFKEKVLSSKEAKDIEKKVNASFYNYLKDRVDKIANRFSEYKEIIEKGTKNPKFQKEAVSLKEIWKSIEAISQKKEIGIEELCSVLAKSTNLLERSEKLKAELSLENLFEGE